MNTSKTNLCLFLFFHFFQGYVQNPMKNIFWFSFDCVSGIILFNICIVIREWISFAMEWSTYGYKLQNSINNVTNIQFSINAIWRLIDNNQNYTQFNETHGYVLITYSKSIDFYIDIIGSVVIVRWRTTNSLWLSLCIKSYHNQSYCEPI